MGWVTTCTTTGMSKITFRADDELITQLEEFDASKSEVMREALREYLGTHAMKTDATGTNDNAPHTNEGSIEDLIAERVDTVVADRIDALVADRLEQSFTPQQPQDVNVNLTLDSGLTEAAAHNAADVNTDTGELQTSSNTSSHTSGDSKTSEHDGENDVSQERSSCTQCGENLSPSHVYCPNCGEKSSHRVFCECGDELRSDWAFCPSCGRRTPAADVLDQT